MTDTIFSWIDIDFYSVFSFPALRFWTEMAGILSVLVFRKATN